MKYCDEVESKLENILFFDEVQQGVGESLWQPHSSNLSGDACTESGVEPYPLKKHTTRLTTWDVVPCCFTVVGGGVEGGQLRYAESDTKSCMTPS